MRKVEVQVAHRGHRYAARMEGKEFAPPDRHLRVVDRLAEHAAGQRDFAFRQRADAADRADVDGPQTAKVRRVGGDVAGSDHPQLLLDNLEGGLAGEPDEPRLDQRAEHAPPEVRLEAAARRARGVTLQLNSAPETASSAHSPFCMPLP